jgi:hypothetical protein
MLKYLVGFLLAFSLAFSLSAVFSQSQMSGPPSPPNVPIWTKYSLVSIANGANGCTNANGCWQVNGVYNSIRAAALTQDVIIFTLSAKGFVSDTRIKTAVACTGTTTALTGLGTAASNAYFQAQTYDLQPAAANTNYSDTTAFRGAPNAVQADVVASLKTTAGAQFIDTLAAGCAVEYWLLVGTLP